MPLSSDKNDIARLCDGSRSFNSLPFYLRCLMFSWRELFPRPASISLIMAAGSSERGLSLVRITRSLFLQAISAIIGLLPVSRSPPQPMTVMTFSFPPRISEIVASTFFKASGVCAHNQQLPVIPVVVSDVLKPTTWRV